MLARKIERPVPQFVPSQDENLERHVTSIVELEPDDLPPEVAIYFGCKVEPVEDERQVG